MVIVLMTNSVLYETFDDHRSFFIFNILMNNRFWPKANVLPFPPPIIECIEALESIHLRGTVPYNVPAHCGKENNATNTLTKCGDFYVQIILQKMW